MFGNQIERCTTVITQCHWTTRKSGNQFFLASVSLVVKCQLKILPTQGYFRMKSRLNILPEYLEVITHNKCWLLFSQYAFKALFRVSPTLRKVFLRSTDSAYSHYGICLPSLGHRSAFHQHLYTTPKKSLAYFFGSLQIQSSHPFLIFKFCLLPISSSTC